MKSQKLPAGQICCEVVGFFHVKEVGEVGEGRCHWRVLREKGYRLTYVFKDGFGCCAETGVSGTGLEAGRRARGCCRDPDEK